MHQVGPLVTIVGASWREITGFHSGRRLRKVPFLHTSVNCVRWWKCGMGCSSCMGTLRPQIPCRRQGRFKQKGEELEGRAEYFNTLSIGIYFYCLITSYFQHSFLTFNVPEPSDGAARHIISRTFGSIIDIIARSMDVDNHWRGERYCWGSSPRICLEANQCISQEQQYSIDKQW